MMKRRKAPREGGQRSPQKKGGKATAQCNAIGPFEYIELIILSIKWGRRNRLKVMTNGMIEYKQRQRSALFSLFTLLFNIC